MRAIKAHRLAPKSILDRRKVPVKKTVPPPIATPESPFRRRPLPKTISSLEALPILRPTTWLTLYAFPSMRPKQIHEYPSTFLRAPLRKDILHRAIQYETNLSRGTGGNTKTRGEVRGSTRKIRRQKGTGMARVGSRVAPGRRGGGIVFGPRTRSFATKIQNKVYAMAYRTAISYRFGLSQLIMVTPMLLELPKTKLLKILLRELKWGKNAGGGTLFITINERTNLVKAARVLGADVTVTTVREVKVRDLLLMGRVVIEKGALERLLQKYGVKDGSSRGNALRRDPIREYERLAKLL